MIQGRYAPGTSGAIIVYDLCTTTGGTAIYPPYDYYYYRQITNHGRETVIVKKVKMKRPKIAEPLPPQKTAVPKLKKLKLTKNPFNGCCHTRL